MVVLWCLCHYPDPFAVRYGDYVCHECGERGHVKKHCREWHSARGTLETVSFHNSTKQSQAVGAVLQVQVVDKAKNDACGADSRAAL